MNSFKILSDYPWDFVSVIIDLIYYLIIITGAVFTFIYFKLKKIKIFSIDDNNGCNIIIQNITKNTIFIKDIKIITKCKNTNTRRVIQIEDLPKQLNPKTFYQINLDYIVENIKDNDIVVVETVIYENYNYKKRIK